MIDLGTGKNQRTFNDIKKQWNTSALNNIKILIFPTLWMKIFRNDSSKYRHIIPFPKGINDFFNSKWRF